MKTGIHLQVETIIESSLSGLWEALTRPDLIKEYFFGTDTYTDWKPGHPIHFKGEWKGKSYEDKGTVLEVIENKRIRYTYWSSMSGIEDKPENYVTVTYDLAPAAAGNVKLTVTQDNIPDEKTKQHAEENWRIVLHDLKEMLEKRNELTA